MFSLHFLRFRLGWVSNEHEPFVPVSKIASLLPG